MPDWPSRSCPGGQDAQSLDRASALRPVRVARLHQAEPDHGRRAAEAPGRGRAARRHLQSGHLREGHRRLHRLRGPAQGADEAARPRRQGGLRDPGHPRHPGRRRHPAPDLRVERQARRLRQPGGLARPRPRHPGHPRGGPPSVEGGRPRQRDDQGAGHPGRHPGHQGPHRRRHQRQRHAAVRAGGLRGGGRGVHRGAGGVRRQGRRSEPGRERGQLLHQPHRQRRRRPHRRAAEGHREHAGAGDAQGAAGSGRHRQREADLPALQGDLHRSRGGRRWATAAPAPSGCCGPAPAPRTRTSAT